MNIKAYAKFNLSLDVKDRRSDGYHEISSLMQEISVCDDISILVKNAKNGNEVGIRCSDPEVPCDERNTCHKAVFAFFSCFGIKDKLVKITIKKGIPVRSGLGGGSSDAAAVINALNKILKIDAPADVLEKIALEVGADVPFFIRGGMQRANGIGEKLTPVTCNFRPYFVVAVPDKGASTEEVYRIFDGAERPRTDGTSKILHAMSFDLNPYDFLSNSLFPAAVEAVPEIGDAFEKLSATSTMVNMTGSGSAVYAVYETYSQAFEILQKYKKEFAFISACVCVDREKTPKQQNLSK